MKLVTADQMRAIDRDTIDNQHVPGLTLMENAGHGIAERILRDLIHTPKSAHVAIFCGKGNNGGDGFVISRYLHQAGVEVDVWFVGPIEILSADARASFDRAAGGGVRLHQILAELDIPAHLKHQLIVDAVFGTGFSGVPNGLAAQLIEFINRQHIPVAAVDLPSGLNADTGSCAGIAVKATNTYTLALPKYGLFVSPGRELAGKVDVVPIGVPDQVIAAHVSDCELTTCEYVAAKLPVRKPDGHKGDFGWVLCVAGSTGMTGAAVLAAESALRSGCGLVRVACPQSIQPTIAGMLAEAVTHPLPDVRKKGALALRALGEIISLLPEYDSVILGPGIGRYYETSELMRRLVSRIELPTVIDADGLNAFENHSDILADHKGPLVITPHAGEFKRLTGIEVPSDIQARICVARDMARLLKLTLVLKGSPTIVAGANGECFLNPTGNSGMATAGSGDVLTGIIGSFLAQGMSVLDAAVCGAFIHGLAGDLAAADLTPRGMIAGDMVRKLPQVFSLL
jgi:hydroxyethylthiazole kinase-like uncharacterized protein yjeF